MNKIKIKRESDANNIIEYATNGKINVIFGAGVIGGLIKDVLEKLGIKINLFLVNNNNKKNNKYKNIEVVELSEFKLKEDECNILYSINSDELNIMLDLINIMKKNILFIDGMSAIFNLLEIFYKKYFEENSISILNYTIDIEGVRIINPFLGEKEFLNAFLFEAGDLLLPMKDDYSYLNEGPYEYGNVILKEGDVVFDCGANIGLFSSIAASKGCYSYSFEPVPKTIEYLKQTERLYSDKIKISDYALSDKEGIGKLYITESTNISNSILNMDVNNQDYINIKITTIDNYVKLNNIKKLDFIKADIEGAERYMLIGAKETLSKFGPKLSICTYHLEDDKEVLEKLIKDANPKYVVEHKWKKLYAYIPENK